MVNRKKDSMHSGDSEMSRPELTKVTGFNALIVRSGTVKCPSCVGCVTYATNVCSLSEGGKSFLFVYIIYKYFCYLNKSPLKFFSLRFTVLNLINVFKELRLAKHGYVSKVF